MKEIPEIQEKRFVTANSCQQLRKPNPATHLTDMQSEVNKHIALWVATCKAHTH